MNPGDKLQWETPKIFPLTVSVLLGLVLFVFSSKPVSPPLEGGHRSQCEAWLLRANLQPGSGLFSMSLCIAVGVSRAEKVHEDPCKSSFFPCRPFLRVINRVFNHNFLCDPVKSKQRMCRTETSSGDVWIQKGQSPSRDQQGFNPSREEPSGFLSWKPVWVESFPFEKSWSSAPKKLLMGLTGSKRSPFTHQPAPHGAQAAMCPSDTHFLPGSSTAGQTLSQEPLKVPAEVPPCLPWARTHPPDISGWVSWERTHPPDISGWVSGVTSTVPLIHTKEEEARRFEYTKAPVVLCSISLIKRFG